MCVFLLHGSEKREEQDKSDVAKCQQFVNLNKIKWVFIVIFLQLFYRFETSKLIFGKNELVLIQCYFTKIMSLLSKRTVCDEREVTFLLGKTRNCW